MPEDGKGSANKAGPPADEALGQDPQLDDVQSDKEQLGERLRDLSILGELDSDAGAKHLLQSLLDKCLRLFECRSGSIFLLDRDSGELELAVAEGPMQEALLGVRQPVGSGVAGAVAESKEGIFVEDIEKSKEFESRDSDRYRTNSFACVPVVYRGELLGVLSLCDKESDEPFNAADVGRMLAIAGFSAGAVRQALQQDELRGFNIELHRQLDAAFARLQSTNQELARLKNFNESILTSIMLGLIALDDKYHVTFYNEPARSILHLGPPDEVDQNLRGLAITCDGLDWEKVLDAVIREGKAIHCSSADYRVESPGAPPDQRVLNVSASPLRDARQKVSGAVLVIEDATERVRMEKRLAASERHAVIGKLAARVAHELNNPLDGILRFINLSIALKDGEDPTREYLTESKKGLERMVGIVSSLLEFSRSTYPTQGDTNVNEVIRDAGQTLRHRLDQRGIEITYDLEEDLPEMRCGELVQVFLNLTKNACDAMEDGGELRFVSRREGDAIRAVVSDTGCGMPDDVLERVFDPFFTTKGASEGTGLGLAICHDIVEKHGGKISVESTVGEGTTFTITLPLS
ncbi:MAG: ATP-binding protein [Planctomycetota bacterium]